MMFGPESQPAYPHPPEPPAPPPQDPTPTNEGLEYPSQWEVRGSELDNNPAFPNDETADLKRRLDEAETRLEQLASQQWKPSAFKDVFIAKVTTTSGTAIGWQEQCIVSGSYADFGPPRSGALTSAGTFALPVTSGQTATSASQVLMIQMDDPGAKAKAFRFVSAAAGRNVSFQIIASTGTAAQYTAHPYKPGTETAASYGTLDTSVTILVWNMVEASGIGDGHMLTNAANTGAFGPDGTGYYTGVTDAGTGYAIVKTTMYYAGCGPAFYTGATPSAFAGGVATS